MIEIMVRWRNGLVPYLIMLWTGKCVTPRKALTKSALGRILGCGMNVHSGVSPGAGHSELIGGGA